MKNSLFLFFHFVKMKMNFEEVLDDDFFGDSRSDWIEEDEMELIIWEGTEMYESFFALFFDLAIEMKKRVFYFLFFLVLKIYDALVFLYEKERVFGWTKVLVWCVWVVNYVFFLIEKWKEKKKENKKKKERERMVRERRGGGNTTRQSKWSCGLTVIHHSFIATIGYIDCYSFSKCHLLNV